MDVIFVFVLGWISVIYASVFMQNRSNGALMISLGALTTMLTLSVGMSREMANVALLVGRVSFWGGIAIVATFERNAEIERWRSSSWRELIFGKVPAHLQKHKIAEGKRIATSCLFSCFCAVVLFLAENIALAIPFLVIAVVFASYYLWCARNVSPSR